MFDFLRGTIVSAVFNKDSAMIFMNGFLVTIMACPKLCYVARTFNNKKLIGRLKT